MRNGLDRVDEAGLRGEHAGLGGHLRGDVVRCAAKPGKVAGLGIEDRHAAQTEQAALAVGRGHLVGHAGEGRHRLAIRMAGIVRFGKALEPAAGGERLPHHEARRNADDLRHPRRDIGEAEFAIELPDPIAGEPRHVIESRFGLAHALGERRAFGVLMYETEHKRFGSG